MEPMFGDFGKFYFISNMIKITIPCLVEDGPQRDGYTISNNTVRPKMKNENERLELLGMLMLVDVELCHLL
jgi:hypothetical protein